MGSTPSGRPSMTSFLFASMNATISGVGRSSSAPKKDAARASNLVGPPQLANLLLKLSHPSRSAVVTPAT